MMHMADALISPAVGGVMMAATLGVASYSIKKVQNEMDDKKIPLMGALGAFVFAVQMINFSIPGTGASGHLGGGLLLAALLGPYAGFLSMASVLMIQALFFADGGLLALGCNIFNLGVYTCFIAYPLVYKPIMEKGYTRKRIFIGGILAGIVSLQLGAFSVVLQTLLSGKTELPFGTFVMLMQPIHLAIGLVEGLVTAAVVSFIWKERPEIIDRASTATALGNVSIKRIIICIGLVTVLTGGVLSWFASGSPDGLEWSMYKTSGQEELESPQGIHGTLSSVQDKTALLPDYTFKAQSNEEETSWSAVNLGTSVSGVVGGGLTLGFVGIMGFLITLFKKRKSPVTTTPYH